MFAVIVFFSVKAQNRLILTTMFPSGVKLLSLLQKSFTNINFSIHRSAMYLFVGCTEVVLHSCFRHFGQIEAVSFLKHIFISSNFWFRCKFLCSRHFQIKTEHVPHTTSRNKTDLDRTISTNGRV
jgi:hypothetical protein